MPDVSVIIPTYDRSEFLRTAIASVLAQTLQDFEIIVVDDASADDTQEVVGNLDDGRIDTSAMKSIKVSQQSGTWEY